ncbi:VOC family protein [Leptobacterium flavescens]|uniref:VOC family protein n=1 Tax=Leptobacterium flavescens TaxID=472055 RepID=A0A6P0UKR6_9FLAO|nr:VOC family protein [Leptobacterium flavescens]NER13010.1 VOC family protein [Leptobacterium flavescens]
MSNAINWFEIPSTNFERAVKFYSQLLDAELQLMEADFQMAFLPYKDGGVGGCVTHGNGNKPCQEGTFAYLNGGDDLSVPLSRVEKAGGKVLMPKTSIGENGYMAIFLDTEGNRVAFHSMG